MKSNTIIYNGKRHNVVTTFVGKNMYDNIKSGKKKQLRLFYTPYWNYLILNFFLVYESIAMCYKCKGGRGQVYVELRSVKYGNTTFEIELGRIIKEL